MVRHDESFASSTVQSLLYEMYANHDATNRMTSRPSLNRHAELPHRYYHLGSSTHSSQSSRYRLATLYINHIAGPSFSTSPVSTLLSLLALLLLLLVLLLLQCTAIIGKYQAFSEAKLRLVKHWFFLFSLQLLPTGSSLFSFLVALQTVAKTAKQSSSKS